ncbi:MAG: hypothetical protein IJL40_04795 [Oscillospiraceae bacterium]|nr:hypothetical protein [Oscillospiraceae bacterium]
MRKRIWLITSDHLEDGLWFPEESDFKAGMNSVGVLVALMSVVILAFILMSNHVHFVIYGTREEAIAFVNELKRRHSRYLTVKYGRVKSLKRNALDIRMISLEDEGPERAIAYVQMNSVAANICLHSTQYAWGTGNVFFNPSQGAGKKVSSFSDRALIRMLHSKIPVPGDWLISDDGYILPSSYVDIDYVHNLYRTPKRMDFFLKTSSKARLRLETSEDKMPSFRDQIILSALPDLCRTLYGKKEFSELEEGQKTEVLRQLRYRFSSNVHQLARVTGMSYEAAAKMLDTH